MSVVIALLLLRHESKPLEKGDDMLLSNSKQTLLSSSILLHECIRVLHFIIIYFILFFLSGQLSPSTAIQATDSRSAHEWWQAFVLARFNSKGPHEYAMSQDEPLLWIISSRPMEAE